MAIVKEFAEGTSVVITALELSILNAFSSSKSLIFIIQLVKHDKSFFLLSTNTGLSLNSLHKNLQSSGERKPLS